MSQVCVDPTCNSKPSTVCSCCNQNVCYEHLKSHADSVQSKLNGFSNEMVDLIEQMKVFELPKIIENSREKLSRWKENCYRMINDYYEGKCRELEEFSKVKFLQHEKEIDQIQNTIADLSRRDKATQRDLQTLKLSIDDLKYEINKFKTKGLQIDIRPFVVENHAISIKDSKPNAFNLNSSNLLSTKHTIQCLKESQSELAANDRFILLNLGENLSLLDRDLTIHQQTPWMSECIYDMCWSSTLSKFIVITNRRKVYQINETTLEIVRIHGIEKTAWLSCTSSETCLYLTTGDVGTIIYQFKLTPTIRTVKQWIPPYSCRPHESILHMQYNNGTMALIVRESFHGAVDLELRSSATLTRLWTLPLDVRTPGIWSKITCRSLPYDEWLVVHTATSRLFHITKDGKLKITLEYQPQLSNATLFGSNTLVVHLGSKVNFHQL